MEIRGTHSGRSTTVSTNRRCWFVRTYSADVRVPPTYVFSVTYAFSSCTYSGDEHDSAMLYWCTWFVDVRILPTYVFHRRTYFPSIRVLLTYAYRDYIFRRCTYVFYRRMCSTDVRVLSTYAFYGRTWFRDVRIRDYAFGDFGTTQSKIEDSGLRRTFWTQDLMKKIAVDLFSGLSIASKIMIDTLAIYDGDVDWIKLQFSCLYITTHDFGIYCSERYQRNFGLS